MTAKPASRGTRPAPARTRDADEPEQTWWCHNCGAIFHAWAAAERHTDTHAHHRIVWKIR